MARALSPSDSTKTKTRMETSAAKSTGSAIAMDFARTPLSRTSTDTAQPKTTFDCAESVTSRGLVEIKKSIIAELETLYAEVTQPSSPEHWPRSILKFPAGRKLRIEGCATKEELANPAEFDGEG